MTDHRGAGAKFDNGKPCLHSVLRYFPRALEAIARINEHGAAIHGWDSWDTIEDAKERYDDARLRHDLADAKGEEFDADSGQLHAAHRAWGNLAVLELQLREQEETAGLTRPFADTVAARAARDPGFARELAQGNIETGAKEPKPTKYRGEA